MQGWQGCLVLMSFVAVVCLASGCAARTPYPTYEEDETSIERPAEPLDEEQSLTDRIGEVGVVLLVVVVTIGGIVGTLFALSALP